MISAMAAVEIIGPMELFTRTVEIIQDAGTLHIVDTPLVELSRVELLSKIRLTEQESHEREACASAAQGFDEAIRGIPAVIARAPTLEAAARIEYERLAETPLAVLSARARELLGRARSFARRDHNLSDDIKVLAGHEKVLAAFAPLLQTNAVPRGDEMIGVIFERRSRRARDQLRWEIERISAGRSRFAEEALDGGRHAVLIAFPPRDSARVRALAAAAGIDDMLFPRHLRDLPFGEALAALKKELDGLGAERRLLREQRDRFFEESAAELCALRNLFRDRLALYDALPRFARTRHAFIVQGWLLGQGTDGLRKRLAEISAGEVVLREVRQGALGAPPVQLSNARPVDAFEPLLSLFPSPGTAPSIRPCTWPPSFRRSSVSCWRTSGTGSSCSWPRPRSSLPAGRGRSSAVSRSSRDSAASSPRFSAWSSESSSGSWAGRSGCTRSGRSGSPLPRDGPRPRCSATSCSPSPWGRCRSSSASCWAW